LAPISLFYLLTYLFTYLDGACMCQSAEALSINRVNQQLCVLLSHFYADDATSQVRS